MPVGPPQPKTTEQATEKAIADRLGSLTVDY